MTGLRQQLLLRLDALTDCLVHLRDVSAAEVLASEVLPLLDAVRFLELHAERILTPQAAPGQGPRWAGQCSVTIHRRPLGRVLILSPGNYPLFLAGVQMVQALAAGNTVLLKPQVGFEAPWALVMSALDACGLADRVRILPSSVDAARAAITQGVDLVVLTGSVASGRDVMAQCAATLTPTIMELSGSDAVLVGPGADLERVRRALQWGRALNHGQTCMVPQRVLIDPCCGPLPGAEVVPVEQMGNVVEQSPYGLGVSIFGRGEWVEAMAARLRCGLVVVNDLIAPSADPRVAFGGRKQSGFGTTRGAEGSLAMTASQSVVERGSGTLYHLEPTSRYDLAILRNAALLEHGTPTERLRALPRFLWALIAYRLNR